MKVNPSTLMKVSKKDEIGHEFMATFITSEVGLYPISNRITFYAYILNSPFETKTLNEFT